MSETTQPDLVAQIREARKSPAIEALGNGGTIVALVPEWLDTLCAKVERLRALEQWQPIAMAPKGSWPDGPTDTRDPAYREPPKLLLACDRDIICVGYFDAYYAQGGNGYDGAPPWVEALSGERINPTHWMPIPAPPQPPTQRSSHDRIRASTVACHSHRADVAARGDVATSVDVRMWDR